MEISVKKDIVLETNLVHDEYTKCVLKMYDVPLSDKCVTTIKNNINLPEKWNVGLIYGPSGAGKSTLLKTFGNCFVPEWTNDSLISNFKEVSPSEAIAILSAVGFSTPPAWLRPYSVLSNGEKFRADLAKTIINSKDVVVIDEFTSVVDRNVAKAVSGALQKYIRKYDKKVILASCHADIIEWLEPDWVYNPVEGVTRSERSLWQRPKINLKIFRAKYEAWDLFKHYHYLSNSLHKASRIYLVNWNDIPVGIVCILAFPHAVVKNAWRESRTVILPDYQGLGLGTKISDYFGSIIRAGGGRFYSRTTHPAMITHRLNRPDMWRVTLRGKTSKFGDNSSTGWTWDDRDCISFEYIGPSSSKEEGRLFWENNMSETSIKKEKYGISF